MKKMYVGMLAALLGLVMSVHAAFTPPTADQIAAAAEDPSKVEALIAGATPEEAAAVLKAIYEKIVALNLAPEDFTARVALVTGAAFKAMPNKMNELAVALGTLLGGAPDLAQKVGAIVAASIATTAGPRGNAVATAFVNALAGAYAGAPAEFIAGLRSAGRLPSTVLKPALIAVLAPVQAPDVPPIIVPKPYVPQALR